MNTGIVNVSGEGKVRIATQVPTQTEISERRRVRFIIGSLDVGGTESHLAMILPELAKAGYHPHVITLTHKGVLADKLEHAGIQVYAPFQWVRRMQRIPVLGQLFGPLATLVYLISMFKKQSTDLTCFYLPAAYCLGGMAALLTGESGKTVMFRRSLNKYQERGPLVSVIERYLHRRQRKIVGNSKAVISDLVEKEGVPADRTALIYNGIDALKYDFRDDRESIRAGLELADEDVVLCIVANLIPYKGHCDLIEALSMIAGKIDKPWKLLCVGNGIEQRKDLVALVREHGLENNIKWLGRRHDVPEILAAADIGLLVSHQEGFSNSVLEGMVAGLPMIVTDVGGNPEAVEHGVNGLVVRSHNPRELGDAILVLMHDKQRAMQYGRAGRERVQTLFSLKTCCDNYISLFSSMIKPSS